MQTTPNGLRVLLLVGTLGQGGAEKQLLYVVRAFQQLNVEVQILTLTRGEYYETHLINMGIQPLWVGRCSNPLVRLALITFAAIYIRPHILFSTHFYTNIYTYLISRLSSSITTVGSIRNNGDHEIESNGRWAQTMLHSPHLIIANSYSGMGNIVKRHYYKGEIRVLQNVIDLAAFDESAKATHQGSSSIVVVTVARLVTVKHLERFLEALYLARKQSDELVGWIVGDGPEREHLGSVARELGLSEDALTFWGSRSDVPSILVRADIFMLTSDREGFPNVLLEAMAARLPIITTPAGDAGRVVQHSRTGFVTDGFSAGELAEYLNLLADNEALRRSLGQEGRRRVEQEYGYDHLQQELAALVHGILEMRGAKR